MKDQQAVYWQEKVLKEKQGKRYKNAPDWFKQWREKQMQIFLKKGFPKKTDEDWKYTHVHFISERRYSMAGSDSSGVELSIAPLCIENTYTLVFVDGHFSPQFSDIEALSSLIKIMTIEQGLNDGDKYLRECIEKKNETTNFEALNATLMTDGLFMHFPKNAIIDKPIHILYISSLESSDKMHHPRHIIFAENGATFTLFEESVGLGGAFYFNNVVNQIHMEEHSNATLYKLQRESYHSFHISNTNIFQKQNSSVNSFHFSVGGKLARDNLNYHLTGEGAQCELNGFFCANKKQHIDNHTCIHHLVSHGSSRQLYKGILDERSHGVFNGKIHVHPKAKKINAHQSNQNILLSAMSEMDTKPELEIYADDVQCSHGATVGTLDENALFYLRSRGVKSDDAKHLLTSAFASEILDKIKNANIANAINRHVLDQLSPSRFQEEKQ